MHLGIVVQACKPTQEDQVLETNLGKIVDPVSKIKQKKQQKPNKTNNPITIYRSFIHNSLQLQENQLSIQWSKDQQFVIQPYDRIYLAIKENKVYMQNHKGITKSF
jgi:hypothetical protein